MCFKLCHNCGEACGSVVSRFLALSSPDAEPLSGGVVGNFLGSAALVDTAGGSTITFTATAAVMPTTAQQKAWPKVSMLGTTPSGHWLGSQRPESVSVRFRAFAYDPYRAGVSSISAPILDVDFQVTSATIKKNGTAVSTVSGLTFSKVATPGGLGARMPGTYDAFYTPGGLEVAVPYFVDITFPFDAIIEPGDVLSVECECYMETNGDGTLNGTPVVVPGFPPWPPEYVNKWRGLTGLSSSHWAFRVNPSAPETPRFQIPTQNLSYPVSTKGGHRRLTLSISGGTLDPDPGEFNIIRPPESWVNLTSLPCSASASAASDGVFVSSLHGSLVRRHEFVLDWSGEQLLLTLKEPAPGTRWYTTTNALFVNYAREVYYHPVSTWDRKSPVTLQPIGYHVYDGTIGGAIDGHYGDTSTISQYADAPTEILLTP